MGQVEALRVRRDQWSMEESEDHNKFQFAVRTPELCFRLAKLSIENLADKLHPANPQNHSTIHQYYPTCSSELVII
jgi:hypothetical protein